MKILLDDHHGIGDVVMFLPVLASIKKHMPSSEVHMLIKSPVEQNLVECFGGVEKFYYYNPLDHSAASMIKLVLSLWSNHYDLGICHIGTNAKAGALLMKIIGCKKSVGETSNNKRLNYTVPIDTSQEPRRARKNAYLMKMLGYKDVEEEGLLANLSFVGDISDQIEKQFGRNPKVAICIGTGDTVVGGVSFNGKKWPDKYWLELIDNFTKSGIKIVLLGGGKEKEERNSKFEELSKESVLDLVGKVKLSGTLEAISKCDLLIAGDTGLGFCAAQMDIPTLSLLGPSDPNLAAPYGKYADYIYLGLECSPCYGTEKMRDCTYRKCMEHISVEEVYNRSMEMIHEGKRN